mgnify:CR=1 FL=1
MLLRNIDLNLLVVLDALLTEKHVTRTGVRLHLSQPAISHSLNKLRVLLDDPLLIRQGNEVVLSALAQNLQAPLKEILGQIETLLGQSIDFVPAESQCPITGRRSCCQNCWCNSGRRRRTPRWW